MSAQPQPDPTRELGPSALEKLSPAARGKVAPAEGLSTGARLVQMFSAGPLHLAVVGLALLWTLPTLGLIVSSFRTPQEIRISGWWMAFQTPLQFTLENYERVVGREGMGQSFMNSLIITIPAVVLTVGIAGLAAYAFSWMEFPGRDLLFLVVIGLLVVPIQMTLIPILRLFTDLRLTGTFVGIWLAHTAYGLPFAIFLLRNFFVALPKELFEAAFLEGATHLKVFSRIVLPLSVPSLAALTIFQFLWVWNDLLVALVFVGGSRNVAPMTVTVSNLVGSFGNEWHLLTSAAIISMLVPLLVFFSLQRYFVQGILAGAVKG